MSRRPKSVIRQNRLRELVVLVAALVVAGVWGAAYGVRALLAYFGPRTGPLVFLALVAVVLVVGFLLLAAVLVWTEPIVRQMTVLRRARGGVVDRRTVVTADGVPLHVEVEGDPDAELTVVFLHGWMVEQDAWRDQRAALADSPVRRVFYDMRGHGQSGWAPYDLSLPGVRQLARDLRDVVDSVAPDGRLVLVGHSCGGMTITAAAAALPELFDRVSGVLLCASSAGGLRRSMTLGLPAVLGPVRWVCRRYASATLMGLGMLSEPVYRIVGVTPWALGARFLATTRGVPPEVVAHTTRMLWDSDLRIVGECLNGVVTHDERAGFAAGFAGVPTTVMTGSEDRLIPPAGQRATHAALPHARYVEVKHTGHMIATERPELVNTELDQLLDRAAAHAARLTQPHYPPEEVS